jgi:hypothetical protein
MNEMAHEKKLLKKIDVLLVIFLLLLPGIRGYSDWHFYEYVLFIVLPLLGLFFQRVNVKKIY